jgi:hypothetical protein
MWSPSSETKNNPRKNQREQVASKETTHFSETSVGFQRTTWRCISEDRTLRKNKLTLLQQNAYYCCFLSTAKPRVLNVAHFINFSFGGV